MVSPATHVLGDESRDRRGLEEAAACDAGRRQTILEQCPKWPAQPDADRHAEALFAARHDLGRKQVRHRALEEMLRRHAADLDVSRYPTGELDESMIEERRTYLEPRGHRRAVGGHEGLVGEIEA